MVTSSDFASDPEVSALLFKPTPKTEERLDRLTRALELLVEQLDKTVAVLSKEP